MAHRQSGEAHPGFGSGLTQGERGLHWASSRRTSILIKPDTDSMSVNNSSISRTFRCRPPTRRFPPAARSVPGRFSIESSNYRRAWGHPIAKVAFGGRPRSDAKASNRDRAFHVLSIPVRSSTNPETASACRRPESISRGILRPDARRRTARLYLAQQFFRITADAIIVHFHDLDFAGRVDDESAAQREAFFLDQHLEIARERGGSGPPTSGYCTLTMVSEVSCHALWAKWVSVDTP